MPLKPVALWRLIAPLLVASLAVTATADTNDFEAVKREARGQTVYFNAWGGDLAINRYLDWAADELAREYGVALVHVKVTDIAEAVTRIRAERAAGRNDDGSVDLLWINGENFAALKAGGLLYGPFAEQLPNAELVDWEGNPTTRIDMTVPTEGYEVPWGTAALTLFYDTGRVDSAPRDPAALLAWIERNPGRLSYPQPPSFVGSAFLKQLLLLLADEPGRLTAPPGDDFARVSAPLWSWLDRAHPHMWRSGRLFPPSGPAQRELVALGELDWMLSYNPSEASRAISQGELPPSIAAMQFSGGALANSHYLAIPYNAGSKAGALVAANFLLSPEAQLRKADERYWGDPTVIAPEKLAPAERRRLASLARGAATPPPAGSYLPEPHPGWTTELERAWLERYVR
jgi:putative thiamine transport system substrate-binding protein